MSQQTVMPLPMLGAEMTIAFAADWAQCWRDALFGNQHHRSVDLGGITDFDSSGMQLLMAARRTLSAQGQALEMVATSAAVRDALTVFGLQAWLTEAGSTRLPEEV